MVNDSVKVIMGIIMLKRLSLRLWTPLLLSKGVATEIGEESERIRAVERIDKPSPQQNRDRMGRLLINICLHLLQQGEERGRQHC